MDFSFGVALDHGEQTSDMKLVGVCLLLVLRLGCRADPSSGEPVEVSVDCRSDDIRVSVSSDLGFDGMIYPRGLSENSSCLVEYSGHGRRVDYVLPLHSCNTMSSESGDGLEYFNTLVVQPHPKLVTGQGRRFHVRCKYQTDGRKPASENDAMKIASAPLPVCTMKILRGKSESATADHARIGDQLTVLVAIDDQDDYEMKVTNCLVRDGLEWSEQPLINNEGCPVDDELMGPFQYSRNNTRASVSFAAHKFPYSPSVYYRCNVKLCPKKTGGCDPLPPKCDGAGGPVRSKREAVEIRRTGNLRELIQEQEDPKYLNVEVYSGLYVDEADQPGPTHEEVESRRPTPDKDDFCVSTRKFAVGVAVAGVLLTLAVLLLVICILHRRRRRKGTSAAGSSIYSGPYSNPAYSRD